MKSAVVIGRDILRQFYEKVPSPTEIDENKVISEILNIQVILRYK